MVKIAARYTVFLLFRLKHKDVSAWIEAPYSSADFKHSMTCTCGSFQSIAEQAFTPKVSHKLPASPLKVMLY